MKLREAVGAQISYDVEPLNALRRVRGWRKAVLGAHPKAARFLY